MHPGDANQHPAPTRTTGGNAWRLVVAGSGFAALTAARHLRRLSPEAEITLVAPAPEFVYSPSLIWIPTGLRRSEELRVDLTPWLARQRVRFRAGWVTGLAEGGRRLLTTGGEVANDGLVIATGARFLRRLSGIEHALTLCTGIGSAEMIRARLAAMPGGTLAFGFAANPHEPQAIRGGPMFELLFGIDTLLRRQGRRDRFKLVFFNASAEPGKRLGERAVKGLLQEMARRGIEARLGHKLLGFDADRVRTEGGDFPADLILFMPGLTGPAWAQGSGLPLSPGGFIQADAGCRVRGIERVYVAGDAGSYPGPDWLPKQAHMADLQARAAADNLWSELQGRTPTARFRNELVCIVDAYDRGSLVYRSARRSLVLPSMRLLHWAKRAFERQYLRGLRA